MTQTTTPTQPPFNANSSGEIPFHPSDVLMNLIVALLAPMFFSVCAGNMDFARIAAIETVNAYRARSQMDLIAIAQIIAFGLSALACLSRSMADDIPLPMVLRLQVNSNALHRSAEQNRRVLTKSRGCDPVPLDDMTVPEPATTTAPADDDLDDAELTANLLSAQKSFAVAQMGPRTDQQTSAQAPIPVTAPTSAAAAQQTAEKRHQAMWAIAMVKEAAEITASIPNLPPAERAAASIRAAALGSTANELLTGAKSRP